MASQKLENLLNLSLEATEGEITIRQGSLAAGSRSPTRKYRSTNSIIWGKAADDRKNEKSRKKA